MIPIIQKDPEKRKKNCEDTPHKTYNKERFSLVSVSGLLTNWLWECTGIFPEGYLGP